MRGIGFSEPGLPIRLGWLLVANNVCDIALTNSVAIEKAIDDLQTELIGLKKVLSIKEADALENFFDKSKTSRDQWLEGEGKIMPLPELIEIIPQTISVASHITVPGSKSITNRALILAALAKGKQLLLEPFGVKIRKLWLKLCIRWVFR